MLSRDNVPIGVRSVSAAAVWVLLVVSPASALLFESEPDWVTIGPGDTGFGQPVHAAGDVNGDGYSDVVVGASLHSNAFQREGQALLYLGGPAGLADVPSWSVEGGAEFRYLGYQVKTAGDTNGDGFDDVLITTLALDDGTGEIYLFEGGPAGLGGLPAWEVSYPAWSTYDDVSTVGDVNGDGFSDIVLGAVLTADGPSALAFFGSAGGLSITPDWEFPLEALNFSVSTAGDVNGDGFDDVLIGMAEYSIPGTFYVGKAQLVLGSATGPASTPSWEVVGERLNEVLGAAVGTAGDINHDGYSDVLIGAPGGDGEAWLYLGGPTGLDASPAWSKTGTDRDKYATQLGPAGDVNGDGISDFYVATDPIDSDIRSPYFEVYLGGSIPGATPELRIDAPSLEHLWFAASMGTAGDVNGDGFSELIVSSSEPGFPVIGSAYVYHGGKLSLLCEEAPQELLPPTGGGSTHYGRAVASLGDVDADGYGDVAVGAYGFTQLIPEQGLVEVYRGSPNGAELHWARYGSQEDALFGWAVAGAGDVNGDGYEDLLIGSPQALENDYAGAGRVDLHLGSASGIVDPVAWSTSGNALNELKGYAVAGQGDVNGDGYADVVVGIPGFTNGETFEGAVELYLGSSAGLASSPDAVLESGLGLAIMGVSVDIAGDVDGDGYDDLLVGASGFTGALDGQGAAVLYRGTPSGVETAASWAVAGSQADAAMGLCVAGAGDVNADGYADLLVAAPMHVGLFGTTGRVDLHFGGPSGPSLTPDQVLLEVWGQFGSSLAALGDLDRDGYDDVAIGAPYHGENPLAGDDDERGRVIVFRGGPDGLSFAMEFLGDTENELLGSDLAGPLDIDGDGFEDLLMGASGYDLPTLDTGRALVLTGQCDGIFRPFPVARRLLDDSRIPPGGGAGTDAVRLGMVAHSPMGRARVQLEWEMVDRDGTVLSGRGHWVDTGDPVSARSLASGVSLDAVVSGLDPTTRYGWRVRARTSSPYFPSGPWLSNPGSSWTEMDLVTGDVIVDVQVDETPTIPRHLAAPSPNPFRSSTTIRFELAETAETELMIFGINGRRIRVLKNETLAGGKHTVEWDGRNAEGRPVATGIYFVRLRVENETVTRRVTVLR